MNTNKFMNETRTGSDDSAMTAERTLAIFEQTGAYLHGHFRLTSGLHSPEYLQCALVLQHPEIACAAR